MRLYGLRGDHGLRVRTISTAALWGTRCCLALVAVSARESRGSHPVNIRALAHDTDILYLRHTVDLDWIATGWPMHAAPTGGAWC